MDADAEMKERHARLLARYADQAASLADDLHAAALAAETPEQKQALSLAFHRTGRTLRQTLALEAKLRRDARLEQHADDERAQQAAKAKTAARKSRVRNAVESLIWTEVEDDEQVAYLQLLENRLDSEDLADPEEPIEALIARVAEELGLEPPNNIRHPDRSEAESRDPGATALRPPLGPGSSVPAVRDDDDEWRPSG